MLEEKTARGVHKEILKVIKKQHFDTHLDIGCGTGALINRLIQTRLIRKHYCTDINENNFRLKNVPNVIFRKTNINEGLPFKGSKFNLITCIEVIEHVENHFELIRDITALLEKNGILIISSPNIYNIFSRISFLLRGVFINFGDEDVREHINPLIENIFINRICKDAGLKLIEKTYSSAHIPLIDIYLPFNNKRLGAVTIYKLVNTKN